MSKYSQLAAGNGGEAESNVWEPDQVVARQAERGNVIVVFGVYRMVWARQAAQEGVTWWVPSAAAAKGSHPRRLT